MTQYVIDILIKIAATVAATIVTTVVAAILTKLKHSKNEKVRQIATKIAETVESVYRDATSATKLKAFKELCDKQGINVRKATKFLEEYIIPISKNINVVNLPKKNENDEDGNFV